MQVASGRRAGTIYAAPGTRRASGLTLLSVLLAGFVLVRMVYHAIVPDWGSTLVDEALVAAVAVLAPIGLVRTLRSTLATKFMLFVALHLAVLVTSGLVHPYSFERGTYVFVLGLLLDLKMFVLFLGLYVLAIEDVRTERSEATLMALMKTLIAAALVNAGPVLLDVFGSGYSLTGEPLQIRSGFYRPHGLFNNPVPSAQLTLFAFIGSLALLIRKQDVRLLALAAFLFLMLGVHVSVKEIVAGLLVVVGYFLITSQNDLSLKGLVVAGACVAVGAVLVSPLGQLITDQFSFYLVEAREETVRNALYSGSWDIARQLGPLGAGPSTFASEGSRTNGLSSLYVTTQVYGLWGATYEHNRFLLDAWWPKVLAESGFVGFALYIAMLAVAFLAALTNLNRSRSAGNAFIIFTMVAILLTSFASPAFSEELMGPLFFSLAAIAIARAAHRPIVINPGAADRRARRPAMPGRPARAGQIARRRDQPGNPLARS